MEAGGSGCASGSLECVVGGDCIDLACGADSAVTCEDLVAEIAGVGAETPLVDAVIGAEGAAAFGEDFEIAPAAEWQVVWAEWQGCTSSVASAKCTGGEHAFSG